MAHANDSSTGPVDLLQRLVTWLISRGWTNHMSQAEGSGWRAHLSNAGIYVHMRALVNENKPFSAQPGGWAFYGIVLYLGTGFNGGADWNAQAGGPTLSGTGNVVGAFMPLTSGAIPSYHFFDDGANNIAVVVEYVAGSYQHMGWGSLIKSGAWTGGEFFFASSSVNNTADVQSGCPCSDSYSLPSYDSTSFYRADVDAFTGKWLGMTDNSALGITGKKAFSPVANVNSSGRGLDEDIPYYSRNYTWTQHSFQGAQVSDQNGQINLLPLYILAARDAYGKSILGRVPNILFANATERGFDKASALSIGSDAYLLFPSFAVRRVD